MAKGGARNAIGCAGVGWIRGDSARPGISRMSSRIRGGSANDATPSAAQVSLISLVSQAANDIPAAREALSAAARALVER